MLTHYIPLYVISILAVHYCSYIFIVTNVTLRLVPSNIVVSSLTFY